MFICVIWRKMSSQFLELISIYLSVKKYMCDVATNTLGTYDSYFNQYVTYKNSYVIII